LHIFLLFRLESVALKCSNCCSYYELGCPLNKVSFFLREPTGYVSPVAAVNDSHADYNALYPRGNRFNS
jgi:hypothetical protein